MRRSIQAAAFSAVTLGFANVAMACGAHGPPDSFSAYPGLGFFRPDLLLLYPVLSGTLERPFYARAGYATQTWAFSIQANLLASLAMAVFGFAMMIVAGNSPLVAGIFVFAPVLGLLVKRAWFRRVPRDGSDRADFGWFVLATVMSTAVVASLPFWMNVLGTSRQDWAAQVQWLKVIVSLSLFPAMIALHVYLFKTHRRDASGDARRGFEVVSPSADGPALATLANAPTT